MAGQSPNIQYLGASGLRDTYAVQGGGGGTPRSLIDAQRMGVGRTPSAEYPDGYLGTANGRQQDRLFGAGQLREVNRPNERGVHKGERIAPTEYEWPTDMQPIRGLRRMARAVPVEGGWVCSRANLSGSPVQDNILVNDGKSEVNTAPPVVANALLAQSLEHLAPDWR